MVDKKELFTALAKAQMEYLEPKKTKKAYNYYYAPMEEIRKATCEALAANGLFVYQTPLSMDGEIGIKTIVGHSSGAFLEDGFTVKLSKLDPQSIGSAISYFRRYSMMAALGLAPEDDDAQAAMPGKQKTVVKKPAVEKLKEELYKVLGEITSGGNDAQASLDVMDHLGVKNKEEIVKSTDQQQIVVWLEALAGK